MTERNVILVTTLLLAPLAIPSDWSSFRGPGASGVAEAGKPPIAWDITARRNLTWTTAVPGLGHSSPVVWRDRIYLTSAVVLSNTSGQGSDDTVDLKEYKVVGGADRLAWRLYCLDRRTGRIVWERTAHEGFPRIKRHSKASHASATAATDGKYIVTMMGSEGLYVYSMKGRLLWKHDLGPLDVGYVDDPKEQWGPASSPVIHEGMVIVQNDRHKDSYIAAFDIATGAQKWRVGRDEMPAWSTPVVHQGDRTTIVTNSPRYIRGHDPATGKELWSIPDNTQVKVVTPVIAGGLVIVTGGYPTAGRPIFGIRASTGEIAWKLDRGSSYTPSPIVYRGILYVCVDNGVLSAYEASTGKRLYQQRIAPDSGSFSASPVAADGRLYFPSEDGIIYVVRAGETFELLARNDMKEMCLASPAISGNLLLVRTRTHLHALEDVKVTKIRK